ncbi:SulP family inorganic anion transporter [Polyangium sp. 15x6]|uniref:SulP family inorganic anion transporter n=1 Tax=Polyangium sp. 15x6 TaxID=3042687 RepID=UPI00249A35F0|nr:SulP family inorganic anion transporter [Polyangium sp. 15x6]MDI3284782.1 SulP family inorganic anion transporter [Polyangium sp. 15x6]
MTLKENIGKDHLRYDAAAGLVVFLVALPLCLGIALASGAPLLAGLVAGVVGGIVVGFLSGSDVSVSGPAAGLTVIVATAIHSLGYQAFLAAVIVGGVLQIAFGSLRLGAIADYVPTAVIKGMLAAIGIVIVLKQIPHALGRDLDFELDMSFIEPDGKENTLSAIVRSLLSASGGAVVISLVSLFILLTWDKLVVPRAKIFKLIPAPLVVVVVGTLINEAFRLGTNGYHLKGEDGHLVSLPILRSPTDIVGELPRPLWAAFKDQRVYITGVTLAAVASLESLLALEAGQRLDPFKRIALPNRELIAQGLGNITSGLLGGLPVTSVVVRTSANVYAGGRTRWSTIFHAFLLLAAVLFLGRVLNHVPLAALAAILIVIGSKLAPRSLFQQMWREGLGAFVPFTVTILAIVFTDLLKGVLIGLAIGVFFVIRTNSHAAMIVVSQDNYALLRFNKDISFVHKAELKEKLAAIPEGTTLIVDGTRALHIDRDAFEVLDDFVENAKFKDIKVEFKNLRGKRPDGELVAERES